MHSDEFQTSRPNHDHNTELDVSDHEPQQWTTPESALFRVLNKLRSHHNDDI